MISSQQLQTQYIDLYKVLREYTWPMRIVELIADLEIAIFQMFPSMENVRSIAGRLLSEIDRTIPEPEDQEEVNKMLIELQDKCDDTVFCKIMIMDPIN